MVVMVMAAASMAVVMVMAFLPVMVVLMAFPIVMVLIALFPIVIVLMALFPIVLVPMALFPFMVMMLMAFPIVMLAAFPHLCQKVIQHGVMLLNDFKQLSPGQFCQRCCYDDCITVLLTEHVHILLHLCSICDIGTAEHNGAGIFNLVIEKLTEILHIHLALCSIYNGHGTVQLHFHVCGYIHHCLHHI